MKNSESQSRPKFIISSATCNSGNELNSIADEECSYKIAWSINAHTHVGSADPKKAILQHDHFKKTLKASGADVLQVPFIRGAYDSVFIKDNAILGDTNCGKVAFLANPATKEREREQKSREQTLKNLGFKILGKAREKFEGGDLVKVPKKNFAFLGYEFRSSRKAAEEIADALQIEVFPLQLKDPYFYHLDTALAFLNDGSAFACREAFSDKAWQSLQKSPFVKRLISVKREEALKFALNWVEIGKFVILGSYVPEVIQMLEALGKSVHVVPLNQFQYAGGSAACLTSQIHNLKSS